MDKQTVTDKHNERYRSFYHNNKEYVKEKNIAWANENFEKYTFNRVKQRAKRQGTEFTIELEDLVIPTHCPLLETPLICRLGEQLPAENIVSVDRIDPSKGYIKGNIQILSQKANRMKNNATDEELYLFCKNYLTKTRKDLDDRWSKTNLGNTERGGAHCIYGTCVESDQSNCNRVCGTFKVPNQE